MKNVERKDKEYKRWTGDTYIGIAAAFIALFALIATIYSSCETRRNYRISVTPHAGMSFYKNKKGAGWKLFFGGLGPSQIKSFRVLVDGQPKTTWQETLLALGIKDEAIVRGIKREDLEYECSAPDIGSIRRPATANTLIWFMPGAGADMLARETYRIYIEMCYCSLYEECWITTNREGEERKVHNCKEFEGPIFRCMPTGIIIK